MQENDERILYVVLTADTDADFYFGDQFTPAADKSIVGWDGFRIGKDIICDELELLADEIGTTIPITWFLRCDQQIQTQYGDAAFLYCQHKSWWEERLEKGDEIQWHPHLYRYSQNMWTQETDIEHLKLDLQSSFERLKQIGINPDVIRIGEAYQSNELISEIMKLGLKGDSSGLPGRYRKDHEKTIDWKITPNYPFKPSRKDYRCPGEDYHDFWQIPMNTVPVKVSYDSSPILRYINLAFQPGALDEGIATFIEKSDYLISMTHPFELVEKFYKDTKLPQHPLLSFNSNSFLINLKHIINCCRINKKKIKFITMSELLKQLS